MKCSLPEDCDWATVMLLQQAVRCSVLSVVECGRWAVTNVQLMWFDDCVVTGGTGGTSGRSAQQTSSSDSDQLPAGFVVCTSLTLTAFIECLPC